MQGARRSPQRFLTHRRCWHGGKRGLRVVSSDGKAVREGWGDTNARKTLINDRIVAPCGLKGKGKGRGRDKEGGWEVEEAHSRSRPVVILQSGNFSEFYFLHFFFPPLEGFVLCAESEGVKGFKQSKIHLKSLLHSTGVGEERKCFARTSRYSPTSAKAAPNCKCTPVNPDLLRTSFSPNLKRRMGAVQAPKKSKYISAFLSPMTWKHG